MKIIVKISDIEIEINRPAFREQGTIEQDSKVMTSVILPTLTTAVEKAKELYNNRIQQLNK